MVPIHDTDLAQERWSQAEWQHYELWEKVEVKLRRRRGLWIGAAAGVFLLLSSIPVLTEHLPKWTSLRAARILAEQINWMKRAAGTENQPFRLEFAPGAELQYTIYRVANCAAPEGSGTLVRHGNLNSFVWAGHDVLISPEQGRQLGIPGLVTSLCYDPLLGSVTTPTASSVEGFGVIPERDLASRQSVGAASGPGRLDRMSVLIFKGPSAEVSFE